MSVHEKRYPNETSDYRAARDEVLKAEMDLRAQVEKVARLRRTLPLGGKIKEDYEFDQMTESGPGKIKFSRLFAPGKDTLALYSYMYSDKMENPCPSCTSLGDTFNGSFDHMNNAINLYFVSKTSIERMVAFKKLRGWDKLPFLSSTSNSYNNDYFAETSEGGQMPMMNIFLKKDDGIYHFWGTELLYAPVEGHPRHMDMMWPVWNLFDLTPGGREGRDVKLTY